MADSICVTCHKPAAERCITCHKPVCGGCLVKSGGRAFCSNTCSENYAKFHANYKSDGEPSFLGRLIKLAVVLVLLAVLAVGGLWVGAKVLKNGFCIEQLKKIGM